MADNGKVNIHGKEYETVASRVQRFRGEHKSTYSIVTEIVSRDDQTVVMKASITQLVDGGVTILIATGYAEESRTSSSINRTSALENAETSAIGRALANFGMAGTEYASADEVAHAVSQRAAAPVKATTPDPEPPNLPATILQKSMIMTLLRKQGIADDNMVTLVETAYGNNLKQLTYNDAQALIKRIKDDPVETV